MHKTRSEARKGYKNFLLDILDTWQLFNKELPRRIEEAKQGEELQEERRRKLDPHFYQGDQGDQVFSVNEIPILKQLATNSRISYLELAKNLGISRRTARKRIEKMIEEGKIRFSLGINYQTLNLDFLLVNVVCRTLMNLRDLVKELKDCPRVFFLAKDISRSSMQILFGTENLRAHSARKYIHLIEKLQADERVRQCDIISLNPEMMPQFLLFTDRNFPKRDRKRPCDVNCSICEQYINHTCGGCPATEDYTEYLFRTDER